MKPNPFVNLLHSRKFWMAILDMLILLAGIIVGRYATPEDADFILKIVAILQPVFVTVIAAIAYEDGQALKAGITTGFRNTAGK
jgi:hypothetical protein